MAKEKNPKRIDRVQAALEKAAKISGSGIPHRELQRFSVFCSRAIFSNPKNGVRVKDDPDLPVYPWVRKNHPNFNPEDISAMSEIYLEWTTESCAIIDKIT